MQTKRTLATAVVTGALAFSGAGMAQAAEVQGPVQSAGAAGGLVAVAVNADRTVDIDEINVVSGNGDILSDIDVDVQNNHVLSGITVQALNNNDIDVQDVIDVNVVDNVLVVVVDAL